MVRSPEVRAPSAEPCPPPGTSAWRRWGPASPGRLAAVLLLGLWVGPVSFAQTDAWRVLRWLGAPVGAAAEPRIIPAGVAMELDAGTNLKLHLRDGSVLEGRYLGRALLDSATYATRFAARSRESSYAPFALGETLHVALRDGRQWSAPFAGYAELALLLRSPEGPDTRRVPFESAREIRRADGEPVEPAILAREFRAGSLPSAEALSLWERGAPPGSWAPRHVAVEDIERVSVELPAPAAAGTSSIDAGSVVGIVILSVVLAVVLVFVIIGKSVNDSSRSCRSATLRTPSGLLSALPITTRPFDRDRGCYVGDPLAAADPWPGLSAPGSAAVPGPPASAPVPAAP